MGCSRLQLDVISYNCAIASYGRGKRWLMSAMLLSVMDCRRIVPDVFSLSTAINACNRSGWATAGALLNAIHLRMMQQHLLSYNSAIYACASSGEWVRALSLLASATVNRHVPDIISYNVMSDSCDWLLATHHLLRCTRWARLRLSPISYTTALDAAKGSWPHALHVLRTMELSASAISYNSTLKSLSDAQWMLGLSLIQKMEACKMSPDAVTLSSAPSDWLVAAGLLEAMALQMHQLNTISFNNVIDACDVGGRWSLAAELVSALCGCKLSPDALSFGLAIRACRTHGQEAAALKLLQTAQDLQLCHVYTCNSAISVCHVGGSWAAAVGLLDTVMLLGLQPDAITLSSVIGACERAAQWTVALGILLHVSRKTQLDGFSLNSTLSACEKAGVPEMALKLLSSVGALHLVPDVISFNSVISACKEGGYWVLALGLFLAMRARLEPDVITYNSMISTCKGPWPATLGLLTDLTAAGLVPSMVTHSSLVAACTNSNNSSKWRRVLSLMIETEGQRMLPNGVDYVNAFGACELAGEWVPAAHLLSDAETLGLASCRKNLAPGRPARNEVRQEFAGPSACTRVWKWRPFSTPRPPKLPENYEANCGSYANY